MMKFLKIVGLLVLGLSFLMMEGALWGAAAERDFSLFPIVKILALFGFILFAIGWKFDKRGKAAIREPMNAAYFARQAASAFLILFQLCTVVVILNFLVIIFFPTKTGDAYKSAVPYSYLALFSFLFVLAWFARRKLQRLKNRP